MAFLKEMKEITLNDDHIKYLYEIYYKRARLIIGTMLGIPSFFGAYIINGGTVNIIFLIIPTLFLGLLIAMMFYKLRPLKNDIRNKSGILQDRVIIRKTYFKHVTKYYFFFDDIKFPNKEVTREEFLQFSEGDNYFFPVSKHSKIILDTFKNYKLM